LLSWKGPLALCNGLVVTHGFSIRKALNGCRRRQVFIEVFFQI